jgi:hypothetical protein
MSAVVVWEAGVGRGRDGQSRGPEAGVSDAGSKKEAGSGCGCDRGVWKAFHGGSLVEARWTARHEKLLFLHVWWPPQQPVLLLLLLPPPGFRHPAPP